MMLNFICSFRWLCLTFLQMNELGMPTREDLSARAEAQMALHGRAATLARERFGKEVFVRAVVEISNYCRENCVYRAMRRSNKGLHRFRANHEQPAELLIQH